MNDLTNKMNWILTEIDKNRWIAFSKDDSTEIFKAKDKLRAFGLIERHGKLSWQLTGEGYKAVELGGFDQWADHNKIKESVESRSNISAENISIISGSNNMVDQSKQKAISDNRTTNYQDHKRTKNPFKLFIIKFWWTVIIPLIIGLILLGIDKGWFN